MTSGRALVVSSVTYIAGRPRLRANFTARSVVRSRKSSVQSSAYCRIGLEPRKVAASISSPVAGQAKVQRVDPQVFHQVQNLDLLLDGRVEHGGRLKPVAQRLIIEHGTPLELELRAVKAVPVVDEVVQGCHFD